jgi:hypothetical protein
MYMFFNVLDDPTGLDTLNGQCYNKSIMQNLTFSIQGLPLGLSSTNNSNSSSNSTAGLAMQAERGTVMLSVGMASLAVFLGSLFSAL